MRVNISGAVVDALIKGYEGIDRNLGAMFEEIIKNTTGVAGMASIQKVHKDAGERAQRAIVNAYAQRVTARRGIASRNDPAYRGRTTRLAGTLRKALQNDKHVRVSGSTIFFIDRDLLDEEAKHWYRLNFGVGRRGARSKQGSFPLLIGGVEVAELALTSGPSQKPMFMPRGFFVNSEGKRERRDASRRGLDAFFPAGEGGRAGVRGATGTPRVILTQGIEARNYLDTGLRRLAEELPNGWDSYFRNAFARIGGTTREHVDASVPRPRVTVPNRRGTRAPTRFLGGRQMF